MVIPDALFKMECSFSYETYAVSKYNSTSLISRHIDVNTYIWFSFLLKSMKCCPVDKDLKEEWEQDLEDEANIDENEINRLCNVFKVLSNPIRLKIAYHLLKQDYCVDALVHTLKEKQNLVSHHLSVMKQNEVVDSFRSSRYTYYRLKPEIRPILNRKNKI
ncbi:ArsR/SmtB family transcription factor [Methanomethylovorans sp.]|uniref:ArsR/SmtB family transcription factor n=1 Tax=Methanomethylovorans sp. TaxID=2758717 RepID=UPI00351C09A5